MNETSPGARDLAFEQLPVVHGVYTSLIDAVNMCRKPGDKIQAANVDVLGGELESWLTQDKIDYIENALTSSAVEMYEGFRQEVRPPRLTLAAVPNENVELDGIYHVGWKLGGLRYMGLESRLLKKYSSEQLSGASPDAANKVTFYLLSRYIGMEGAVVDEQRVELDAMRDKHSFLGIPSILGSLAYQGVLKAQDNLGPYTDTYVRHIDLPEHKTGGILAVPRTNMCEGRSFIERSKVTSKVETLVSIK